MSTIIKHKQFPKYRTWTMDLCGRPLTIEVGKTTELASAAAWVKYGDTTVHVAVTVSPRPRDGIDFFPLAASPAALCAGRAAPLCPPCWPAA